MVFFPIMFNVCLFSLCVFCSIVMFRLLFLMHIRLICVVIKITYLLTSTILATYKYVYDVRTYVCTCVLYACTVFI